MSKKGRDKDEGGYGRPPVEHQFKKGKSGNPKGRPKRPKASKIIAPLHFAGQPANQLWMDEAYRPVTIRDGSKLVTMPAIQAVIRRLIVSAAVDRDRFAQRTILEHLKLVENSIREERVDYFKTMVRHKREGEQLLQQAAADGIPPPQVVPHPDDIIIDVDLGTAHINGPRTHEEKVEWDLRLAFRDDLQLEVSQMATWFSRARKPEQKAEYLNSWKMAQLHYDRINDTLPKRYRGRLIDRCSDEGSSQSGSQRQATWRGE